LIPFQFLASELHPPPERPAFNAADLLSYVTEQISYSVVARRTVLLVFVLLFVVLSVFTLFLARRHLLEHLGWLGPVVALAAAGVFIGLGKLSRGSVPPTLAVIQVVDAAAGVNEVQTTGCLAVYQPSRGTSSVGAEQGGTFELDLAGLEGRVIRRVQTDLDRWHLENLDLPAGVRVAPFRHTEPTQAPMAATARFGPDGVRGWVWPGPFRQWEDLLLTTPGQHTLAVHQDESGSFGVGSEDELPAGQVIASGLLTDRQRAHQRLYEQLLAEPQPRYVAHRSLLLAWAQPVDMHFALLPDARTTGAALLVIPLRFERTPPGERVTIPAAFVDCRRIASDGRPLPPAMESPLAANLRLRFQIPSSAFPLIVENARLNLKLNAPGREIIVSAFAGRDMVPVHRLSSPFIAEQIEISEPALLRPDEHGALYLNLAVGEMRGAGVQQELWRIETVGLEVRGRTPVEERDQHELR
jgi:hypothetical protein